MTNFQYIMLSFKYTYRNTICLALWYRITIAKLYLSWLNNLLNYVLFLSNKMYTSIRMYSFQFYQNLTVTSVKTREKHVALKQPPRTWFPSIQQIQGCHHKQYRVFVAGTGANSANIHLAQQMNIKTIQNNIRKATKRKRTTK